MTSVSTPPTILVRLRATPQLHVEEEVDAVVDPGIGLEVVVVIVVIGLGACHKKIDDTLHERNKHEELKEPLHTIRWKVAFGLIGLI